MLKKVIETNINLDTKSSTLFDVNIYYFVFGYLVYNKYKKVLIDKKLNYEYNYDTVKYTDCNCKVSKKIIESIRKFNK